jgi:GNAT superfamily N-acetyltransferase
MNGVVRRAVLADLDALAAVHVAAFRAGNVPHLAPEVAGTVSLERSTRTWRSLVAAGPRRGVVLVASGSGSGSIAGVAAAGPSRDPGDDGGELYALYVDPGSWGAGYGAALDDAVRSLLSEAGFGRAILWVLEGNVRARGFYEARGWVCEGERREHLGAVTVRYEVGL